MADNCFVLESRWMQPSYACGSMSIVKNNEPKDDSFNSYLNADLGELMNLPNLVHTHFLLLLRNPSSILNSFPPFTCRDLVNKSVSLIDKHYLRICMQMLLWAHRPTTSQVESYRTMSSTHQCRSYSDITHPPLKTL